MTLDVGDHVADHRPNAYLETIHLGDEADAPEAEQLILRASSFGSCERALIAAATGIPPEPPPAWMQAKFDEGTIAEPEILRAISSGYKAVQTRDGHPFPVGVNHLDPSVATSYRKLNESFIRHGHPEFGDGQFAIEWEIWEEEDLPVFVRAHADSIASVFITADEKIPLGTVFGVEAKKFGESLWDEWLKKGLAEMKGGMYAWQVSSMMHATKLPFIFLVGQRVKLDEKFDADEIEARAGEMWKIGEVRAEIIWEPPVRLGDMKAKARRIARAVETGVVPSECEGRDFPCPMWKLCADSKAEKKEVVELGNADDDAAVAEFEAKVRAYRIAKNNAEVADRVKRDLGAELVEMMSELANGEGKVVLTGDWKVTHMKFDVPAQTIERKASTTSYPKIEERKKTKEKKKAGDAEVSDADA